MMMYPHQPSDPGPGTKDAQLGPPGDRDEPYTFGRIEKYLATWSQWQLARLMVLRGRIQDRRIDKHIQSPTDPDGFQ